MNPSFESVFPSAVISSTHKRSLDTPLQTETEESRFKRNKPEIEKTHLIAQVIIHNVFEDSVRDLVWMNPVDIKILYPNLLIPEHYNALPAYVSIADHIYQVVPKKLEPGRIGLYWTQHRDIAKGTFPDQKGTCAMVAPFSFAEQKVQKMNAVTFTLTFAPWLPVSDKEIVTVDLSELINLFRKHFVNKPVAGEHTYCLEHPCGKLEARLKEASYQKGSTNSNCRFGEISSFTDIDFQVEGSPWIRIIEDVVDTPDADFLFEVSVFENFGRSNKIPLPLKLNDLNLKEMLFVNGRASRTIFDGYSFTVHYQKTLRIVFTLDSVTTKPIKSSDWTELPIGNIKLHDHRHKYPRCYRLHSQSQTHFQTSCTNLELKHDEVGTRMDMSYLS